MCLQQKDIALNSLAVDFSSDYHPNSIKCVALSDLKVGTLVPGTRFQYHLEHDPAMHYYNRKTAAVKVYMSVEEPSIAVTCLYAWSKYSLFDDRINEVVRPSCLFARNAYTRTEQDPSQSPNIIFHILASGDVFGEVIQKIPQEEYLRRDYNSTFQSWIKRNIAHSWHNQKAGYQANLLCA